jgi:predicted nucleotidyltransferase
MLFKHIEKILKQHKKDLLQKGVKQLSVFGSTAQNTAKARSDVDILIDFDSKRGLFAFIDMKLYLEKILKRHVDLVTKKALHPALKTRILQEAKLIF